MSLGKLAYRTRNMVGKLVGLTLRRSSFRFSKDYRWGTTLYHRLVYSVVDVLEANFVADKHN